MSSFIMSYQFRDGRSFIEIDKGMVTLWQNFNPSFNEPSEVIFVGSLNEFAVAHPVLIGEMLVKKLVRIT
jgi:hypothetical protein